MHPSIFTLGHPIETYDVLYGVFVYCLPLQMVIAWAVVAYLDMARQRPAHPYFWGLGILLLPCVGAGAYLLTRSDTSRTQARFAVVFAGLVVWAFALAIGLPKIWGPLGPKAL